MESLKQILQKKVKNFVFVGEAGSGKSEIAINFAKHLLKTEEKPVHFFDMDMTKPLFRSRDLCMEIESLGIVFHYEDQFMDAPTLVGGVRQFLKDENSYVVLDVGGDHIGARAVGGFAAELNKKHTVVYYVINAFRPWSFDMDHIDGTLAAILGISKVKLDRLHLINNPNLGFRTTAEEFLEGCRKVSGMVSPYMDVDFACVNELLYDSVKEKVSQDVFPLHLYLTYPWAPNGNVDGV